MLHHIEIYVRNLSATRDFYDCILTKLGYKIFQEWDAGFSYKCDREYIVFVQVKAKYKKFDYNRCRVGLNHIAFCSDEKSTIDEIITELKNRNVNFLYDNNYYNSENNFTIFFEDPDRIKVEIRLENAVGR